MAVTRSATRQTDEFFVRLKQLTPDLEWTYTGLGESFPMWVENEFDLQDTEPNALAARIRRLHTQHRRKWSSEFRAHCYQHGLKLEGESPSLIWYARDGYRLWIGF
jgi:hypothetical protein